MTSKPNLPSRRSSIVDQPTKRYRLRYPNATKVDAANYVATLVGMYADHGKVQPKIYNRGLLEVFQAYPPHICESVIHPVSGLPGSHKWLPSIAEVNNALKDRMVEDFNEFKRSLPKAERNEGPTDPTMRKRIGDGLQALADKLRMDNPRWPVKEEPKK